MLNPFRNLRRARAIHFEWPADGIGDVTARGVQEHGAFGGVGEVADDRVAMAAREREQQVSVADELLGQRLRLMAAEIDTQLV